MKPSNAQQPIQYQLTFEADESRIWETLEGTQRQQVTEYLAKLWIEYVTDQRALSASSGSESSKDSSNHISSHRSTSHE